MGPHPHLHLSTMLRGLRVGINYLLAQFENRQTCRDDGIPIFHPPTGEQFSAINLFHSTDRTSGFPIISLGSHPFLTVLVMLQQKHSKQIGKTISSRDTFSSLVLFLRLYQIIFRISLREKGSEEETIVAFQLF